MGLRTEKNIRKRKRRRIRKILSSILLLIVIIISAGGYFVFSGYSAVSNTFQGLERGGKSEKRESTVAINKDPISILLIGIEDYSSGGANGRTDSLILVTLNPDDKSMAMLSIPRDTYVNIPGRNKKDKINHAHVFGGTDLTIRTVEGLLDIPIDYYAKINFEGFKEVVDEVGGISVDVPFDFWEYSDEVDYKKLYFQEGNQEINGEEALAYVRMRKRDNQGDFGRMERQKQVIKALISELKTPTTLVKIDDIAGHLGANIETNVRPGEMLSFANLYKDVNFATSENLNIEGNGEKIDSIYYYVPTEESLQGVQEKLKNKLKLDE